MPQLTTRIGTHLPYQPPFNGGFFIRSYLIFIKLCTLLPSLAPPVFSTFSNCDIFFRLSTKSVLDFIFPHKKF